MALEPYVVELDPYTKTTLKMYLFKNVQNVEMIRNNIMHGVWNCAVIKPGLILDPFQVAVAANRAVVSKNLDTMVTRTVFTEILYNLSLSKSITQSLSKFGIEKETKQLVCFLVTEELDASKEILRQIEGELCPISDLQQFTSMRDVRDAYKLNDLKSDKGLLDIVVSRIVTKNFISH